MSRKNKKKAELVGKYKSAFDEVIGDPYAHPEPIEGHYSMLKSRSSIAIVEHKRDSSPSPVNQARPNQLDFFCDVDAAIKDGLESIEQDLDMFTNTYFLEQAPMFNQSVRALVEQTVGRILVARKISPVSKYFTVTKQ